MSAVGRRKYRMVVGLLVASLSLVIAVLVFPPAGVGHEGPDEEHGPVAHPENVVELHVSLGIDAEQQDEWKGELSLSEGKVLRVSILQASRDSTVEGARFAVKPARVTGGKKAARQQTNNKKQQKKKKTSADIALTPARLKVLVDAPASATIRLTSSQGSFSVELAKLMVGSAESFLEGSASVRREAGALPLTGKATEDDFPAVASGPGNTLWLTYVEYQPGPELVNERVLGGAFDALVPSGHGDRIRLTRFDGQTWQPMPPVTDGGLDVWRPTVAVDQAGAVWVAWAEKRNEVWNIFARRYQPGAESPQAGKWGERIAITSEKGSDFQVVAATDAKGQVWFAWQGWRKDNYEILLAAVNPDGGVNEPRVISNSKRNDWSPSIAADSRGRVYVAWDTYDRNNYDVVLHVVGSNGEPIPIASSARFEARPHLHCDAKDRVWIAYEEGDEQWGKDYASDNQYAKVGLGTNPGYALYVNRTIRVKCLVKDTVQEPKASLQAAFGETLQRNKSLPRLMSDAAGGLWLLLRHHPLPGGGGETWHSYALRYDGQSWSSPREVPASSNLLDNRPALASLGERLLIVASGDNRTNTAGRGQDDLYVSVMEDDGEVNEPELAASQDEPAAKMPDVHANEAEMVARLRDYRVHAGGQQLQIVRGEFHRHTEFTAHRDQDGSLEDSWRYALDAGNLDWMGNGDHDNGGGHEYMWWLIQKQSDLHQNPPHFVAAMTYERSAVYPNGHRNVIMPRRGIRPLPRGELKGTPEEGTPDTKILYAYLKHFGGICASHTSATNMGTDWRDNDPEAEPIVEIYQGHRHNYEHLGAPRSPTAQTQIGGYQPAGFIWNALERGYRLGFQSSSDHVSTHMSYAAVITTDNSRQAIIDGFKKRHCYGATDNILLVVRSGEHLMGDIFTTEKLPQITVEAHGGQPIAKVSIVRDNQYVYTNEPNTVGVRREYTDMDVKPGETHFYYVRVEQADGNLAWASPMWITYAGRETKGSR